MQNSFLHCLTYLHLSKQIKSPIEGSFLNVLCGKSSSHCSMHGSSASFNNGCLIGALSLRKILMYTNPIIEETEAT